MKIQKLMNHTPSYEWDYDIPSQDVLDKLDWNIQNDVMEAFNMRVVFHMPEVAQINEMTYKEIASMIDGNFLRQKIRAEELQGVFYKTTEGNTMLFYVPSSEYSENGIRYANMIEFDEWEEVGTDPELDGAEKARMLLWAGNIKLHCTCPSFLYHGYQYLLNIMDASIYPEERKPVIKNRGERGIVCKHLNRTLRVLPFHSGEIATAIKQQYG